MLGTAYTRWLVIGCAVASLLLPTSSSAGDLQPPGPPAPTMRTLDSLGFDCPSDIAAGRTNLLFTYATNTAGFDTSITISNTNADPFGTATVICPGSCTCTLNYYGTAAPTPVVSPAINSGDTYSNITSIAAPGFNGYIIATCNFPYAHGFAFLSDVGARNLATSYLAQVICSDRAPTAMGGGR